MFCSLNEVQVNKDFLSSLVWIFWPLGPILLPLWRRRPSEKAWPCAVQAGAEATEGKEWTLVLPELQLKICFSTVSVTPSYFYFMCLPLHLWKKVLGIWNQVLRLTQLIFQLTEPSPWESGCYFRVSFSPIPLCSNDANWRIEAALSWEPWIVCRFIWCVL